MTAPRYDLADLAAALRIELGPQDRNRQSEGEPRGLLALAARLGTDERHLRRAMHHGLTDRQADRYATRVGLHPASIWPCWWEHAGSDADWFADDPPVSALEEPPADAPPLGWMLVAT